MTSSSKKYKFLPPLHRHSSSELAYSPDKAQGCDNPIIDWDFAQEFESVLPVADQL